MDTTSFSAEMQSLLKMMPKGFNKKKFTVSYPVVNNKNLLDIQNYSKKQCLGKEIWPTIDKVNGWMISAETASFMKWGGLGMIASELPEAFNQTYCAKEECLTVVTPMYLGTTKKKSASLENDIYHGAEHKDVKVQKIKDIVVPFVGDHQALVKYKVGVYIGHFGNTDYIFLNNERFFSINLHKENPSAQDGCYVMNEFGVNEVERFAFFSKAVFVLICDICSLKIKGIKEPNILVANDWHSGALAGLMKYFPTAQEEAGWMSTVLAERLKHIPIVHIAHHLGYQGWDYDNTSKILNSLYENLTALVFKNAKAIKNSNPRTTNVLIVHDCYNQASSNFHLADRVVTVSKHYMEEVSKELGFGFDFRDILKMRKDHRNFFGIVNGYDKKLISPNAAKIDAVNQYFDGFKFQVFDETCPDKKLQNKKEFIKLISKIASDKLYKDKVIPLVDIYKFENIEKSVKHIEKAPIFCATSRMVEQKGYDVAAQALLKIYTKYAGAKIAEELPIFIMGGAGSDDNFQILKDLKDKLAEINPAAAKRLFVFRGYCDEFAYAIQLAADFYLMPCRFEPCGLTQMEAMAKGALPVAMSTGGLVDTIEDGVDGFRTEVFFTDKRRVYGTNIVVSRLKNNINAYAETLEKVLLTFYANPAQIEQMKKNAMSKDFSWTVENGSLSKYYNLFHLGHL